MTRHGFIKFDHTMSEDTDNLLIALAQRCGGIEAMFDSMFSFLKRKTDFYHIQKPGDRIGVFLYSLQFLNDCLIRGDEQDFRKAKLRCYY